MARPLRIEYAGMFYHIIHIGDTGISQLCIRLERRRKKDQQLNSLIS